MKYHHGNLRSELIRFACVLCEEHGHDKLSLRGIAKEANVSQTAPYRHFETKESLLASVAAYGFIEMKKSIDKIIDSSKTNKISKKMLVDGMLAYLDFAIRNNNIYEVMFGTVIKDFRNFPDLHDAALDAYSTLKLSVKRYIKLKNDQEYDDNEELDNQYLQIESVLDKLDNNDEIVKPATNNTSSEKTMDCAMIPEKQISKYLSLIHI